MNGIIIVNKPASYTSRDVVNVLSGIFKTKKIGHTGTLDPLATGVMLVCLGKSTKLCEILTGHEKEYVATIKLGIKTDTGDITGNIIEEKEYHISEEKIIQVLNTFLGPSEQTPPIYSAIKVNGKKLYEYARKGENVAIPKRQINISQISLISFNDDEITFKATVSKGTYIRSLIEDICTSLNTVGTMSSLIRTKQGDFTIQESYSLDEIKNNDYKILSNEDVLSYLETIELDEETYKRVKNGAIIKRNFKDKIACLKYNDKIVAIYQTYHKDENLAKPYKMFIE